VGRHDESRPSVCHEEHEITKPESTFLRVFVAI
jgi:hypothetical protein